MGKTTEISREVGGAFSLFGGYIVGRQIEMVPDERLVQAWREVSWKLGVYSIVKFELKDQDAGTKLVFGSHWIPRGRTRSAGRRVVRRLLGTAKEIFGLAGSRGCIP